MFSIFGFSKTVDLANEEHPEGFVLKPVVDTKPIPKETETERHSNIKSFLKRSYLEATGLGTEGFDTPVVDTKPLPEETETERYSNIKSFFNRSYLEATGFGLGTIAAGILIGRYTKK